MQRQLTRLIAVISLVGFLATNDIADARTLMELLRALGNSIAHPPKKSPPRSKSAKQSTTRSGSPEPSATATASPVLIPEPKILMALAAPEAKDGKRDVPYAVPVPGKTGLVTSPFAPREGYIDVSKFPPGTEVKDPFSGRIFRTP